MFIILVEYKKPLEFIDPLIPGHVTFLEKGYQNNYFLASGAKIPRTGGVIISNLTDRATLAEFIKQDPFYIHDVADYELVEFTPSKYQKGFEAFLD